MDSVLLVATIYLACGLITWWLNFGRFEMRDIQAAAVIVSSRGRRPSPRAAMIWTIAFSAGLWPFALYRAVADRLVFFEDRERQVYTFGLGQLQEDISPSYRRWLLEQLQRVQGRFSKRGLGDLPPLPGDR